MSIVSFFLYKYVLSLINNNNWAVLLTFSSVFTLHFSFFSFSSLPSLKELILIYKDENMMMMGGDMKNNSPKPSFNVNNPHIAQMNSSNWGSLFNPEDSSEKGPGRANGGNGQGSYQQTQTGATGGNGQGSSQQVQTGAPVGNYFKPEGNQPWPQGTKQENLDPDYTIRRGYHRDSNGKYVIIQNIDTWGWNTANFCEDEYREAKANSDKIRCRTHLPVNKLCERDASRLEDFRKNHAIKNKNTAYNTENNREKLRNLPR